MDFEDFLQDQKEGVEENEEGAEQGAYDEIPDDLFADLSIQSDENRSKKDSVIFLVDCRKSLFEKLPDSEKSGFKQVMTAYQGFLKSKIISSENDKIGLVFYNIKQIKNNLNIRGINVFHELDIPNASRIRTDLENDFSTKFGYADIEVPLHDALWICNHELKTLDQKAYTKRIFLFTNEDFPSPAQKNDRDQAIQRAKMLYEMDVKLELFPIQRKDRKFDMKRFYLDLIAFDPQDASLGEIDISSKIMDINKRMRAKEFKKRTVANIFLEMGESLKIGVSLYCLVNPAKKPNGVFLDAKTNKLLKSTVNFICKDTGATLYPNQIGTCNKIGGDKVPLTKENLAAIKKFDEPGIKLMGFKPKDSLKIYHNIRTSYFAFPNDDRVTNSSQLCDALIKKMIEKEKIAIVKIVPRKTSAVRFAALVPQSESFDDDHFQTPPGFNLIFLPYADDMRKPDQIQVDKVNEPTTLQVENSKLLIHSITADIDCRNFENPSIQTFYTRLQAIALDEKKPEDIEDLLLPDEENIKKIYAQVIDTFNNAFAPGEVKKRKAPANKKNKEGEIEEEKRPIKKKVPNPNMKFDDMEDEKDDYDYKDPFIVDDRNEQNKKTNTKDKTKMEFEKGFDSEEENVLKEVEEDLRAANLKKLTVEKLKFYLKANKCNFAGKKDQLIDRALDFISSKANIYPFK